MRIKGLFAVPEGAKVTEKLFGKVLLSSVCGILLCMACLIGTTWAWYTVSIDNAGNVIEIVKPDVTVKVDDALFTSGDVLPEGDHTITISRTVNQDDLRKKMELYFVLVIQSEDRTPDVYKVTVTETSTVTVSAGTACTLTWETSWLVPENANEPQEGHIAVAAAESAEPSSESSTEASTESSTEAATETAAAATEPSSEPAAEETQAQTVPEETGPTGSTVPADTEATDETGAA